MPHQVCNMIHYLIFLSIREHTRSGHHYNLIVSFHSKTNKSKGSDHNHLPLVSFDNKITR